MIRRPAGIEARLWAYLRRLNERGFHFRRHAPFRGFILDFVDHDALVAIELIDGEPGGTPPAGRLSPDTARRHVLADAGYAVLRVWTRDAQDNFGSVASTIERVLEDAPASWRK